MEEKEIIKRIENAIEYDKKHKIVTAFDEEPLFRDVLENFLRLYKKQKHDFMVLQAFYSNDYIRKDKLKNKLLNDIKSINEKLYNARNEHMNIFRYYRLKGIKTKAKELLNFIESEE